LADEGKAQELGIEDCGRDCNGSECSRPPQGPGWQGDQRKPCRHEVPAAAGKRATVESPQPPKKTQTLHYSIKSSIFAVQF